MEIERRSKVRYPLELTVRYKTLDDGTIISGVGRTVNVSSSGILITAQHELKEGSRIRVTLEWPSLLDGIIPLQLVTTGRVVWCRDSSLAISLDHYQFRTMGRTELGAMAAGAAATETAVDLPKPSHYANGTIPEQSSVPVPGLG